MADRFSGLVLRERVGEGASSVVYRGEHEATRTAVAIKIAKPGFDLRREALLNVLVERAWGPRLVASGIVESSGASFVATTWEEGAPFPKSLGEREGLAILHAIASSLAELHAAGIRHGDVKPSNILLTGLRPKTTNPQERAATLIDLGLAATFSSDLEGGTPLYIAPEVRAGSQPDAFSDIFALGTLLANALSADRLDSELLRMVQTMTSPSPGGRPRAEWIARASARLLGLESEEAAESVARQNRARRSYLGLRLDELESRAELGNDLQGASREWIANVLAKTKVRAGGQAWERRGEQPTSLIGPLSLFDRRRWLVSLAGAHTASWPLLNEPEDRFVERICRLLNSSAPESWTLDDLTRSSHARTRHAANRLPVSAIEWMQAIRRRPSPALLEGAEHFVQTTDAPAPLLADIAAALVSAGETARAWVLVADRHEPELQVVAADVARRRGDREEAIRRARVLADSPDDRIRGFARAVWGRSLWDGKAYEEAENVLGDELAPETDEVRALLAYVRGEYEKGVAIARSAITKTSDDPLIARLEAACGFLEHARGRASASLEAFRAAADRASRAGAIVEEATYCTGVAAAAIDQGDIALGLSSSVRAILLWERLGMRSEIARAWLGLASGYATIGVVHETNDAAARAIRVAEDAGDFRAAAYARWARIEVCNPSDASAKSDAKAAALSLKSSSIDDRVRASARLLLCAPNEFEPAALSEMDPLAGRASVPAQLEWWGSRAHAALLETAFQNDRVLPALVALAGLPAAIGSAGPALHRGVLYARRMGDGQTARRLESRRSELAQYLRAKTPPEYRASLGDIAWLHDDETSSRTSFAPAQVTQLEGIVRAISGRDGLRSLLEQVLDTMILWTGVERGLLLMTAPGGKLVPRVARNLARRELVGDQRALSIGIASKAIQTGEPVVATDAFSTLGDLHASVHSLKLRSVLAVPLIHRGETLGVVYLDDRIKRGAFGADELAWVNVVAAHAAMAIADAKDKVLLRRAARRAERARAVVEGLLHRREEQLSVTQAELRRVRESKLFADICGESEPLRTMLTVVERIAPTDVAVLIQGESGTGKELVARAVHAASRRAEKEFVSENCASVPESLLESILFGHTKGAFTGATSARAGLFEIADGGTLFLDEIGEMSLGMQAKLLRVVQDGELRPVGAERARHVNVRLIAATHRDLDAMVQAGTFRADLFYRLNVIGVRVPPLRDRSDDIPLLVQHFLAKHAPDQKVRITRAAMQKLTAFSWPGNVRQLENEIRRAVVLGDSVLDTRDLSPEIARPSPGTAKAASHSLKARVDELELEMVKNALERTRGNQTRAAELLGISRFGLQKMMKRLNIRAPS